MSDLTHVMCVQFLFFILHVLMQILWNEEIEEESKHMAAAIQYHRRFSAYFIKNGMTYDPMILCYIQKGNKLQVME